MDEQYQVKKLTSTTVLGTFTKNQIDNLWDEGKLGGTDFVLYKSEWIQISQLDSRINAFEEEKRKAREEEEEKKRQLEDKKQKSRDDKIRAQRDREEAEHREELDRIQREGNAPPPLPERDGKGKKVGTAAAAASGGGGFFVLIILAVLWYQGYWDPADLKAVFGQSKYITAVKADVQDELSRKINGLEWKSKRAPNRAEIIIFCEGTITLPDSSTSAAVYIEWTVNKNKKEKNLKDIKLNGDTLDAEEKAAFLLFLLI